LLSVGSMTPRAWKLVSAFSTIPAQVLCVLDGPKIPQCVEATRPENTTKDERRLER
jgi:hypothetical protein